MMSGWKGLSYSGIILSSNFGELDLEGGDIVLRENDFSVMLHYSGTRLKYVSYIKLHQQACVTLLKNRM